VARVGIDLDGVVYDFVGQYRRFLHDRKGEATMPIENCTQCHIDYPEPTCWEFYKDWGLDGATFTKHLATYDEIFAKGQPYPSAITQLERLTGAGHSLVFITDRSINPRATEITAAWLFNHLGSKWELHITADKASVPVDYFIDDKPENLESMPFDTDVYLCDRPWNKDSGYERVTLSEFVDEVLQCVAVRARLAKFFMKPNKETRVTSLTGGQKGQKLARIGSIDPQALMELAKVAGFGEQKYARLNYLNGYDWSLSYDACQRHLHAFWSGEDLDPESGLPHLAHAGWHCMGMLAFMIHQLGTDDRFVRP